MAFLDNSGDIILDAVLTDTGRLRLAQGDGSFKISKFALGDDEVNYSLYNKSHSSGSAYYDLEILQTPVLEAFTNNTSNLKSKLISLSRTNLLYMPTLKLNENDVSVNPLQDAPSKTFRREGSTTYFDSSGGAASPRFYVAVDKKTDDAIRQARNASTAIGIDDNDFTTLTGVLEGFTRANGPLNKDLIRVDQGLDTAELAPELGLDSDLLETAYIIEMDYRLGRVKSLSTNGTAPVNFIDDDNIASYYLTTGYVNPKGAGPATQKNANNDSQDKNEMTDYSPMVFEGPRGTCLQFRIQASQELNSSTYLFTQIGQSETSKTDGNILGFDENDSLATGTTHYIDTTVRVTGANTGFRLDIPVRYVKVVY